jgi:hypothetical protein
MAMGRENPSAAREAVAGIVKPTVAREAAAGRVNRGRAGGAAAGIAKSRGSRGGAAGIIKPTAARGAAVGVKVASGVDTGPRPTAGSYAVLASDLKSSMLASAHLVSTSTASPWAFIAISVSSLALLTAVS